MGWVNWSGVGWIWMFGHAHEQALGIPRPSLDPMFGKLINQSNQLSPTRVNWVEHLTVREADVFGIHLSSYLFVRFVLAQQYPFVSGLS